MICKERRSFRKILDFFEKNNNKYSEITNYQNTLELRGIYKNIMDKKVRSTTSAQSSEN